MLIAKKQLPQVTKSIKQIEKEDIIYKSTVSSHIIKIIKQKLSWAEKAKMTNLYYDYHFIYLFSSKLLHALPASISTRDLGLSDDEKIMFLKFIKVRILDILKLSQAYLKMRL